MTATARTENMQERAGPPPPPGGAGRPVAAPPAGARPGILALLAGACLASSSNPLGAQSDGSTGPCCDAAGSPPAAAVIDTVVIIRENLFDGAGDDHALFSVLDDLHMTTRRWVIRHELLLEEGMPYDSARAAESERNLRARGLFRHVDVDTARIDGRLAAVVRTRDAWSLQPRIDFSIASDGTVTGTFGITETNVAGTGNVVRAWYVRDVDRDGAVLALGLTRVGGTKIGVGGSYLNLSDRDSGSWGVGLPFRSLSDRWSLVYGGRAFDGRVLQFRTPALQVTDTTQWTRRAFVNQLDWAIAPVASPTGYVRLGANVEVRREEFFPRGNRGELVPDSVYGLAGVWLEYREAEFTALRHFNGFVEEDQDLSRVVFVGAKLAPASWGWPSTGVGTRIMVRDGTRAGNLFLKAMVDGNALWNAAGLDSGRVTANLTVAMKEDRRQITFLDIQGGIQERPRPGDEFDLGFRTRPRLWRPHAFTGTRSLTGTFEHRWYAWDRILHLLGLGFGAFLDYGGAWFQHQDPRFGGNVGISLILSSSLRSSAQIVTLSGGWRFGGGLEGSGDRWGVSLGTGVAF